MHLLVTWAVSGGRLWPAMAALLIAAVPALPAGAPLVAQQLPSTADELVAANRIAGVRITPNPVRITRGDTIRITLTFVDSAGAPAEPARFTIIPARGTFDALGVRPDADSATPLVTPRRYVAWGRRPGDAVYRVALFLPPDSAGGRPNLRVVDSLEVSVADWPVARIEVEELRYRPYAGTSFRLVARAVTTHGTAHATAKVSWRSANPAVATITPEGVASFARPGTVTFIAQTDDDVSTQRSVNVLENPLRQLDISPQQVTTRTGDVVRFRVQALDRRGRPVPGIALSYVVHGLDSAGAQFYEDGAFVAENPGAYRVVVAGAGLAAEAVVEAEARPGAAPVRLVGRGALSHVATSDLWVFTGRDGRDYAYTGTHAQGGGNRMYVWDVTDPGRITLTDSVVVDGRVVNDVKVSGDASWAIITREGASTRRNGIVVLDLSDPAHPTILSELTDSLTAGVHNVWINGNVVYAVNDGTRAMHILDLSDPRQPVHVGRWEIRPAEEDKVLHDVWSDGRYAYLSYWDDGLVILDVGAGTHGGSPTKPAFVSRIAYGMGNTHTAYREGNYVFVGDEIFGCAACINGPRGYIHVVDVSDIERPDEVARFEVPEAGTHNVWVENGILYIAYYQGGVRIVDVSGELRGDLYRQGRQIGWFHTAASEHAVRLNAPMAWGPQPFKGKIFVSDMHSGLWVLQHGRPERLAP